MLKTKQVKLVGASMHKNQGQLFIQKINVTQYSTKHKELQNYFNKSKSLNLKSQQEQI